MHLERRWFLRFAANATALSLVARGALAEEYPRKPVHLLVGYPPGGTTDIVARLIGQWLSGRLGRQFIIENRPGANTYLATEAVMHAPADGYTLLTVGSTTAINGTLNEKLKFDLPRDLTLIAGLTKSPLVLEVHPSVPIKSVPEIIAYAKANPGKISMASFGTGSISHVAGELFKIASGLDMLHVPYRGSGPMLIDLLAGQVQAAFDNLPASIAHITAGRLRPLAVTDAVRSEQLPEVPTVGEFLPGYEASSFLGLAAPKSTPPEIVIKLNREINAGLADRNIKARLTELGGVPLMLSPDEFSSFVGHETEKWAKVVREAKIKVE
jgi:tripartite-type tricarboxylate transporter receptor subunit TctC